MGRISVLYLIFAIISILTAELSCNGDANLTKYCLESNREALIEFKNGLKDPTNGFSSWRGSNCCQWQGIGCDNTTGAVTIIDLHTLFPSYVDSSTRYDFWNLSGEIRPSLLKLKSLTHLDLSFNTFQSIPIPKFFGSLKNLRYLNLANAGFSGTIPPNLGNLSSLKVVDLSGNNFNSKFPDWLANITSLVYVDMRSSTLHGRIPLGLSELPSLRYLNLAGNYNLSAGCFQLFRGSWRKIEVLNFDSNKLHGKLPSSIGNMTFLTDFDLSYNNVEGGIPSSIGNMTFLTYFDLSFNNVEGGIPSSIGRLCNLENIDLYDNNLTGSLPELLEGTGDCVSNSPLPCLLYLDLSNNGLIGKLPEWLGQLQNLTRMILGNNQFTGTLPDSFGQLSELEHLDVYSNSLTGTLSEVHFSKLSNLGFLDLSSNSFIFNVSSVWVPPFQIIYLYLDSCHLGPSFPAWLESQKELSYLAFSNASISGSIPIWFWDISSNLKLLNVSLNQLSGQLPNPFNVAQFSSIDFSSNLFEGPIPLPIVQIEVLDLSNNQFSGPIPNNITESNPELLSLSISSNQLIGQIPSTIGAMDQLQIIDLSRNYLTGSIPSSMGNCSSLNVLDLGNNSLSGAIPTSLGQLKYLQSLHLNDNMFSGEVFSSFTNLSSLETLDLGNNRLSGNIPTWFGVGFANLRILKLRSNTFSGRIPSELSHLRSLQVLDLAHNNLIGSIPASLGDLKAMAQEHKKNQYLLYGGNDYGSGAIFKYYEESLVVNIKGEFLKYTKTLSLVTSIDLSENNLNGDFPVHITKLSGLVALNLSGNQISGQIPENISSLHQLFSLDLSSNKLSGTIPPSMSSLTFLSCLDLSNNNFSGRIPDGGQMSTFSESAYARNPGLCGLPLVKCQGEDSEQPKTVENDNGDVFISNWFYLSVGLGFAVGLLGPFLIIATRKHWSDAYFSFVDEVVYKLPCVKNRRGIRKW